MGQGSDQLNHDTYNADISPVDYNSSASATEKSSDDDEYAATTQKIEADIEQTRVQMSQTIDAIQERLSPQHLAEQAKEAVYDATIGTAKGVGSNMIETIKQNPLPAAIAALSIGWLFRKSANTNYQRPSSQYVYRGSAQGRYQPYTQYGYEPRPATYSNADSGPGVVDRVGDMAGNVKDQAQNIAGNVKDQAQNLSREAVDQVEYYGEQAMEQVDQAKDWLQTTMYENPMALGAVALALGTAVGLTLPNTPVENRVMGEARDTLVEKVQETASETLDKVQSVAQEATSAAQDAVKLEAREQGLTQ